MKNLFNSLYNFVTSLSPIDVVFLVAVLVLIILIVVMIYILRVEDDGYITNTEEMNKNDNGNISVTSQAVQPINKDDNLDLASITKEIESTPAKVIELTPYEEEQEERAIISYDELISNTGKMRLKYEEENISDGLVVKKVNMENLNIPNDEMPKMASMLNETIKSAPVISYEKEEAFLQALKKMQKMLY